MKISRKYIITTIILVMIIIFLIIFSIFFFKKKKRHSTPPSPLPPYWEFFMEKPNNWNTLSYHKINGKPNGENHFSTKKDIDDFISKTGNKLPLTKYVNSDLTKKYTICFKKTLCQNLNENITGDDNYNLNNFYILKVVTDDKKNFKLTDNLQDTICHQDYVIFVKKDENNNWIGYGTYDITTSEIGEEVSPSFGYQNLLWRNDSRSQQINGMFCIFQIHLKRDLNKYEQIYTLKIHLNLNDEFQITKFGGKYNGEILTAKLFIFNDTKGLTYILENTSFEKCNMGGKDNELSCSNYFQLNLL